MEQEKKGEDVSHRTWREEMACKPLQRRLVRCSFPVRASYANKPSLLDTAYTEMW